MVQMLNNHSYMNASSSRTTPDYTRVGRSLNYLQAKHRCCGVSQPNATDYLDAGWAQRYNLTMPYSCCVLKDKGASWRRTQLDDVLNYSECVRYNPEYFHNNTCLEPVTKYLTYKAQFLMGYNFTLIFMGLTLVLLLCCIIACAKC